MYYSKVKRRECPGLVSVVSEEENRVLGEFLAFVDEERETQTHTRTQIPNRANQLFYYVLLCSLSLLLSVCVSLSPSPPSHSQREGVEGEKDEMVRGGERER